MSYSIILNLLFNGIKEKLYGFCAFSFSSKFVLSSFLLVLLFQDSYSQLRVISVVDAHSKSAVPYATIRLSGIGKSKTFVSDSSGIFSIPFSEKCFATISAIGYKTFNDSVPRDSSIIYLNPDIVELEKVVVTGLVKPILADKSIYKIEVIDRKEIEASASNTLGDLLKNYQGYQYRSQGVLGDFIRIQGLSGEHIKVLIDGIPVTGRTFGIIDLNQLNLNTIDHIEIVEGPMSVVYGSDAIAGVVNLITKRTSLYNYSATVDSYYETVGRYNFSAGFTKNFGKHTASVYATRNFNSGWSPNPDLRFEYYKPKLQYAAGVSYIFSTEKTTFSLTSDYLHEELRDPDSVHISVISDTKTDSVYLTYLATDYYYYTTRWNNRCEFHHAFNPSVSLSAQAGYSFYQKQKLAYYKNLVDLNQTEVSNPDLTDTSRYSLAIGRIMLQAEPFSKVEVLCGTEYNFDKSNSVRTGGIRQISDVAAFANVVYKPFDKISFQPGVRYIYNSAFQAPLVYSLNLMANPSNLKIRASYGKAFRAPSLKELYMEFIDNNHHVFGNPDLNAETGNIFNASINYSLRLGNFTLKPELLAFYNMVQNSIQLAIDPSRPGWGYYFNIPGSDYKTKGYQFTLTAWNNLFSVASGITSTGKSNLSDSHNFSYSNDYFCNAGFTSKNRNFSIDLNYKLIGKYTDYAGTFDNNFKITGIQEQSFAGYQTMDLVLNQKFLKNSLLLSTGIKNIFDVTFIDTKGTLNVHGGGTNFAMAGYGRTYFLKLTYRINRNEN